MIDTAPAISARTAQSVDRALFLEQGFLIIRGLIPPKRLESLRRDYELAVERFQAAHPDQWENGGQPRLLLHEAGLIDEQNADTVQFWCDERVLDIASQLLALPDPAVTQMMLMCNPRKDHGPAGWHRDVHPHDMAPLRVLQDDVRENGPRYVQWNIPLYDDSVLWVVPGSHLRLNTAAENEQLARNATVPLPGAIPVELKAGDGVVYINYLLHWGSNYSAKMRRTIHGGHAMFTLEGEDAPYLPYLDKRTHDIFTLRTLRARRLQELTELALRCALHKDVRGYEAALDGLHPGVGDAGRLNLSIYLSKKVWQARIVKCPNIAVPPKMRAMATSTHHTTLNWGPVFADRFTPAEAEALGQRFDWLDQRLRSSEEQYVPGFQSGPMEYRFEEPAEGTSYRGFVASWR